MKVADRAVGIICLAWAQPGYGLFKLWSMNVGPPSPVTACSEPSRYSERVVVTRGIHDNFGDTALGIRFNFLPCTLFMPLPVRETRKRASPNLMRTLGHKG